MESISEGLELENSSLALAEGDWFAALHVGSGVEIPRRSDLVDLPLLQGVFVLRRQGRLRWRSRGSSAGSWDLNDLSDVTPPERLCFGIVVDLTLPLFDLFVLPSPSG